jgi:hypothetical protein
LLANYVLVSQVEPRVEHYQWSSDGTWIYRTAGPGDHVTISIGATLVVDDLFPSVLALTCRGPSAHVEPRRSV